MSSSLHTLASPHAPLISSVLQPVAITNHDNTLRPRCVISNARECCCRLCRNWLIPIRSGLKSPRQVDWVLSGSNPHRFDAHPLWCSVDATYRIYSVKRRPRINTAPYVDLQRIKHHPQINAALNVIHKQFMDRPPEAYTCACGTRPIYAFARSIEEMPFRGLRWIAVRKNGLKRLVRSIIYPM